MSRTSFRVGVCWMSNPLQGDGEGVAYLDGQQRRVHSLSELDQSADVLWLTNIPYQPFAAAKLYRFGNIKNDQVLRARFEILAKEFGLQRLTHVDSALLFSRIGQGLINYTATMTGQPIIEHGNQSQRLDWILRDRGRPMARFPVGKDAEWISASMDAHLMNYATYPSADKGLVKRGYSVARTSFARELLSLPYPSLMGTWLRVNFPKPVVLTPGAPLPAELEGRAAIVRVSLKNLTSDRAMWSPFTKKGVRGEPVPRNWIALPEALSYAEDAIVEVHGAFVTELEPLKLNVPLPPSSDDHLLSANLYAESLIYALGGKTKAIAQSAGYDALAAYIWAYERAHLSKFAKVFQEHGVGAITTVGSLQLQVQMHPDKVPEADAMAMRMGLEPPMRAYEEISTETGPYVEAWHPKKANGAGVEENRAFSVTDWIHNPAGRVAPTSFSWLKYGGTFDQILDLEVMAGDPGKMQESRNICVAAITEGKRRMGVGS